MSTKRQKLTITVHLDSLENAILGLVSYRSQYIEVAVGDQGYCFSNRDDSESLSQIVKESIEKWIKCLASDALRAAELEEKKRGQNGN